MHKKGTGRISIRLTLQDEVAEKFSAIKKKLGYRTNVAVLTHLINEEYGKRAVEGLRSDEAHQ